VTYYRARFKAELVDDDLIVIEDLNGDKSVTNDIERVIATIAEYVTIGRRRIIYRDSSGRWDGVLVRDGAFRSFVPIGQFSRELAIEHARRLWSWRR
jgi:hypothetical protein